MDDLGGLAKEHPAFLFGGIVAVALLAYLTTRGGSSTGVTVVTTGHAPSDPGVDAIETARINAGAQNVGVIASLLAAVQSTNASRDVALSQVDAQQELGDRAVNSQTTLGLANTEAQRTIGLAATAAQAEAARLTAQAQADATAAQVRIASIGSQTSITNTQTTTAAAKATARAADNTSIVNGVVRVIGGVLAAIGL